MDRVLSSPIRVTGVVVYANPDAGYAYLEAATIGRVLIYEHYKKDVVEVASWFSLLIQDNQNPTLTPDFTHCHFSDASDLQPAKELLPQCKSYSKKTGMEQVRIQCPVYIGNILPRGGVGLSPLFGRIFLPKAVIKKFKLAPLRWSMLAIVSEVSSAENFFCGWEAKCVEGDVLAEDKRGIFTFRSRFHKLVSDNFCLLKLLPEGTGFAFAFATDFAEMIEENMLANKEVEVIGRIPSATALSVPVYICYAVLVGSETHQARCSQDLDLELVEKVEELSLGHDLVEEKEASDLRPKIGDSSDAAYEPSGDFRCANKVSTEERAVEKALGSSSVAEHIASKLSGVCSPHCETISVILEAMRDERFVEICKRESPELFEDLRAFVKELDL